MNSNSTGRKPSHSASALNAGASSLLCLLLSLFLGVRHWHTLNVYAAALIFIPFCVHIISQFRRAKRLATSTNSKSADIGNEIFDLVFFASVSNLLLLIYIEVLLRHVDGFF